MRWYYGDPLRSVWNDASLHTALTHTLLLGVIATAITVPLGVAMALGLDRWRGRIPAGANLAVLISFVLPEILIAVSLLFVVTVLVTPVDLGTSGQVVGLVTYQLAYPVVIVRGRLLTIGNDYEEAADRPRRLARWRRTPGADADAAARDLRQRGAGLRRRDRRLRDRALPLRRRLDRAGLGEGLQHRPGRADARAERAHDAAAARLAARRRRRLLRSTAGSRGARRTPRGSTCSPARRSLERPFNRKARAPCSSPDPSLPPPWTPTRSLRALAPFGSSRMLPRGSYLDDAVLAWEREHFFGGWQCVGRASDIAPGGMSAESVGDYGVLLTRDKQGVLRGVRERLPAPRPRAAAVRRVLAGRARSSARTTPGATASTAA